MRPGDKRELISFVHEEHGLSIRRACRAFGLSRTVYGYRPSSSGNDLVIETLIGLAEQFPRYGSGKLFPLVRRQQPSWNHKRVYREYCALKLNLRRKGKKRLPSRHPEKLAVPVAANVCWSVDFMSDVLMSGQRFRTFNVLDDFNREALAILGANPWGDTGVHPAGQAPPRTRLSSVLTAPSAKKCWISMFSTD